MKLVEVTELPVPGLGHHRQTQQTMATHHSIVTYFFGLDSLHLPIWPDQLSSPHFHVASSSTLDHLSALFFTPWLNLSSPLPPIFFFFGSLDSVCPGFSSCLVSMLDFYSSPLPPLTIVFAMSERASWQPVWVCVELRQLSTAELQ